MHEEPGEDSRDDDLSLDPGHKPVLVDEVLRLLDPKPGEVYLDCTLGRAGHAAVIAPRLSPEGRIIGLDVDPGNLAFARQRLASLQGALSIAIDLVRSNFSLARQMLDGLNPPLSRVGVDLLLADLGFASSQMTDSARGLSFNAEGPLDMRLDPDLPTTAADLVNGLPQDELADLIYQFGQDRLSRKIARKIAEERSISPILSTTRLAETIRRAYPRPQNYPRNRPRKFRGFGGNFRGPGGIDPATRTFMALRIAVNAELEALDQLLNDLPKLVRAGGRAAVISFHSLEDRRVKQAFLELERTGRAVRLTRKPAVAGDDERRDNPRSRSAKLRAIRLL